MTTESSTDNTARELAASGDSSVHNIFERRLQESVLKQTVEVYPERERRELLH